MMMVTFSPGVSGELPAGDWSITVPFSALLVCVLEIAVNPASVMAACATACVLPITGGTVLGDAMHGKVLAGGADFQLILADRTQAHLDARYVLELDDGARIWVHNTALRVTSAEDGQRLMRSEPVSPERVYFRCQPRFEAAAPQWAWLAQHQVVGVGLRLPDAVHISVYQVV